MNDAVVARGAWLQASVHATAVEDDVVFLDLRNDAYVCLPGVAADLRVEPDVRRLWIGDADLCRDLIAQGLLAPAFEAPDVRPRRWPGPPTASVFPRTSPAWAMADLPEMVTTLRDLWQAYRGRPLPQLLAAAAPRDDTVARVSEPLLAAVARFHRWSPYAPVSGKCLLRAFMLLRLLRRAGLDALWVFGVTTWPFRAHCWLQVCDVVLDDTVERVGDYTPILVL